MEKTFSHAEGGAAVQRRGLTRPLGMLAAVTIALSGIGLVSGPPPASAAAPDQQSYVFDSPNGSTWVVPAGITEVSVGIRGGDGGNGDIRTGGAGANFAVKVQVKAGDVLTVYAGQDAHGKVDYREGGAGYIKGGNGGKGSLIGENGGGGGGAGAVKLNGELIAVAGGGGGGGGATSSPTIKGTLLTLVTAFEAAGGYDSARRGDGVFKYIPGGVAGGNWRGVPESYKSSPTKGGGSTPGAVGLNGVDDPKMAGYQKSGSNGGSSSTGTVGGGGGGGGGGWPASGTGGGGGRKFWHFSGGSGGGAGMSWVTSTVPGVSYDSDAYWPEDIHVYKGPLAERNTAKIFVPLTSTTTATAPAQVEVGQSIPVRIRTNDNRPGQKPLDGSINLFLDGAAQRIDYHATSGDYTFTVPTTMTGTFTYRAEFRPQHEQYYYKETSTHSSATVQVTVVDPTPEPQPIEPSDVVTNTTIQLENSPMAYGDFARFGAKVKLDGPVLPAAPRVNFEIDGEAVDGDYPLLWIGGDELFTVWPHGAMLSAGEHRIVAKFPGFRSADPQQASALPSQSEPLIVNIAKATTSTEIALVNGASKGAEAQMIEAYAPVTVSGTVSTATGQSPDGEAVLLADGETIANSSIQAGSVSFAGVIVPIGTRALSIAYHGGTSGNFEASNSSDFPISIVDVPTVTSLEVFDSEVRADESVLMAATVTKQGGEFAPDPRGSLEILFDGEVVDSVPAGMDSDEDPANGEAYYLIELSDLTLGVHQVSARFVPAPGFAGSSSEESEFTVRGIETVLTPSATTLSGKPGQEVKFSLSAQVLSAEGSAPLVERSALSPLTPAGVPVDGYVQAFKSGAPLGDPVAVEAGIAEMTLPALAQGTHEIDLQFVPEQQGMLKASATVQVTIAVDGGSGSGNGTGGLSNTGADGPLPIVLGAGVLLLAAGALFYAARRKRSA